MTENERVKVVFNAVLTIMRSELNIKQISIEDALNILDMTKNYILVVGKIVREDEAKT